MSKTKVAVGASAGGAMGALAMFIAVPQIEKLEGVELKAYRDVAGVLTICAGHTGPDVMPKQVATKQQCNDLTLKDAAKASAGVLRVSPHLIFHPMQLAAAISFSFNVGTGAYSSSSVAASFNSGDFIAACNNMGKWVYITDPVTKAKVVSKGLANRREVEINICKSTLTKDAYLADVTIVPDTKSN